MVSIPSNRGPSPGGDDDVSTTLTCAGVPAAPPFELVDNESTWLDVSDLVFVDPVGTGYSRPAEGVKGEQFYGVKEDVQSVGNFIRLWTTRYRRWPSPKFLAGESYGTTRAAGLSEHLLEKQGISLNGIILISSVLNFQTIASSEGNDLPYALYIPSFTATVKDAGENTITDPITISVSLNAWMLCAISLTISAVCVLEFSQLFLFSEPHGFARLVEHVEGGFDEFVEFLPSLPSSSATRALKIRICSACHAMSARTFTRFSPAAPTMMRRQKRSAQPARC